MSNWPTKKLLEISRNASPFVPVVSGGAALYLLDKIIFSNLEYLKFLAALITVGITFISSALLYYFLKKLSQNKDKYLISSVGKMVEDVYVKYGISNTRADTDAMNQVMQTIVNVVRELKDSMSKGYIDK